MSVRSVVHISMPSGAKRAASGAKRAASWST
jgi:hypothetical protein